VCTVPSKFAQGLGCAAQGLGCVAQGLGCVAQGLGCAAQGLGCAAEGLGCVAPGLGCVAPTEVTTKMIKVFLYLLQSFQTNIWLVPPDKTRPIPFALLISLFTRTNQHPVLPE
jgi:hypothetical protein